MVDSKFDDPIDRKISLARLARAIAMTELVNMHQAKSSLSRLVERALAGDDIVIARNGEPLVRLVPIRTEREPRIPGRSKGRVWIAPDFDTMSEEELQHWQGP